MYCNKIRDIASKTLWKHVAGWTIIPYYSASCLLSNERTQLFVRINDKQGPWKEQKEAHSIGILVDI